MKKLIVSLFLLVFFFQTMAQESSVVMIDLDDSQLKMSAPIEGSDKWVPLSNKNGTNNLENYPIRPEYSFPGNEVIYKLPKMDGEYFFYVNDRKPDDELDVFVLTDPYDASSAIMWMNGTGAKQYMKANPNQDYYLVVDGFEGITASLNFAIAPAVDLPNVCIGSTEPILLDQFRTMDLMATDIMYSRISGEGGEFIEVDGIFIPDDTTTTSMFQIKYNNGTPPMALTENVTIFMIECPEIPTLSQWLTIILSLLLLTFGLLFVKMRNGSTV